MRFYTKVHKFYCGIDLHARTMFICILDQAGEVLFHRNKKATPEAFLKIKGQRQWSYTSGKPFTMMGAGNVAQKQRTVASTALLGLPRMNSQREFFPAIYDCTSLICG
mgnify:CR=1 FL=1